MRMPPLPGHVPTNLLRQTAVLPANGSGTVVPAADGSVDVRPSKDHLRSDFARELETRLTGWVGTPGTEKFDRLQEFVSPYLKPATEAKPGAQKAATTPTIDLDRLPVSAKNDLLKLQHAAEGIEAIFVKKLLGQMRSISFDKEASGPMADFAKDMMDQAVADQAAKGNSSIGIARMVFLDTAQTLVRAAIAKSHGPDPKKQS